MKKALVITAKVPMEGRVKTRLLSLFNPKDATRLYECFLKDTIEKVKGIDGVDRYIAYHPKDGRAYFEGLKYRSVFSLIPQNGSGLGERLKNLASHLFLLDYGRVVVIGSDSPSLPSVFIKNAFDSLSNHSIALGPCRDGGYYLIGMNMPVPQLFEDIPWSTPQVFEKTMERIDELGCALSLLPEWYDVDTPNDVDRLIEDIDSKSGERLRHTERFLAALNLTKPLNI